MDTTSYNYGTIGMEQVFNNIDEYIIPENQEACKLLWNKNIFTKMCNNYDNDNSWITLGDLSLENQEIFNNLSKTNSCVGKTWLGIGITVPYSYKEKDKVYEAFKTIIDEFVIQDVQKEGYMTEEEFLIYYTDCYKIENKKRKLDKSKMKKSFLEYLKDSEFAFFYDKEEHKVFYNSFYYGRHLYFKGI